jgi:hypothetical protein
VAKAKHTPGPWKVRKEWHGDGQEVYPNRKVSIGQPSEVCVVSGIYGECKANARLIAAAPDLLEALQLAAEAMGGSTDPTLLGRADKAAQAAIAKATGAA